MDKNELQNELAKFLQKNGTEHTAMLISDAIDKSHRDGDSIDYMHRAIAQHLRDINRAGSIMHRGAKSHVVTTKVTR